MRTLVRLAAGLAKLLAGLVLAALVFGAGTYFQVRGALPPYAGRFEAKGLKAPVEILRDNHAVPHIIAGSIEDASFALGYVHAQDRFWQMELMRRTGQGRLAELVPPRLVGNGLVDGRNRHRKVMLTESPKLINRSLVSGQSSVVSGQWSVDREFH